MKILFRSWPRAGVMASLILLIAASVVTLAGQTGPAVRYRAPRLPGTARPDLNGTWQSLNTAYWDLEGHAAETGPMAELLGALTAQPAGLSVVEGGEIPYQPWAAAKKKENFHKRATADPSTPDGLWYIGDIDLKCFLPGVPRATYQPFPFQILQSVTGDTILIAYEYASAARVINMQKHQEAPIDSWMGWSNGRWEGDTLVVDVTGLNDKPWFDRSGNFHSDAVHVVERYTPISPDHLMYEATIEDPKVFTRPWKIIMPLYRRLEKNIQLLEFKCVEFAEPLMLANRKEQTK